MVRPHSGGMACSFLDLGPNSAEFHCVETIFRHISWVIRILLLLLAPSPSLRRGPLAGGMSPTRQVLLDPGLEGFLVYRGCCHS